MSKVVQKDMKNSVRVLFKEDDVPSPTSNPTYESNPNGEEPATPPPHRPLVSDEWGSSNHKYLDANITWSAQDKASAAEADDADVDGGEESDNNATARPSTDGDRSETGAQGQENQGNAADPSHHFILCNAKKKRAYLPLKVGLYQAALKGDWKIAKSIFDIDSSTITMKITDADETALHIAAAAKHIHFVENLVELTSSADLAAKNEKGNTALAFAAASGVVRIAKVMVDKNPDLPDLHDLYKPTPVLMAVAYKRKDMASFLFSKTKFEALDTSEQIELLIETISTDYYDIALEILKKKPELAKEKMENGDTALHVLARKPSAIGSHAELSFWKTSINSRFHGLYNKALMQTLAHQTVERLWNFVVKELTKRELYSFIKNPSRLLHDAARVGNAEFLIILIRSYPDLLWKVDDDDKSIFHIAVENRQESVFSLIYEIGGLKDFLANFHDRKKQFNMLHLAGLLAAPDHLSRVSGAALQMQRELLWFKEVEKIVVSSHLQMRCDRIPELSQVKITQDPVDKLTPRELFTKEHEQLRKQGEEWMKNTANSCMLVATLIATVVFAAAFTVPGGNDDKEGIPIFRQNQAFTVFVISDVAALVLSTTSILTFLSILTSRYAEEDFLVSLPSKLLFGLLTLFVSIACMVVAFSAAFFIAYDKTKAKIPLGIGAVAILPVGCFCVFHSKLVVDIMRSAYWSKFSLRQREKRLF
ncbi:ankyrin repeat-containing protein ITN1-like [Cucurbita pepo subsp. pepo]|uniref:ankyrin repeat-containing protein ITN1-like n=1 Tax=Cucurbita pepo subsp. pepo TaxID=3664 RepID=UPI000C9D587A|nr:ankyrin repeat-containing protein ITN1-like [Cucurbita pepo subsp. pepo]